jgi:hypothetical protein
MEFHDLKNLFSTLGSFQHGTIRRTRSFGRQGSLRMTFKPLDYFIGQLIVSLVA